MHMDINSLKLEKFSSYKSKVSRKISLTKSYSFGIPPAFFKEHEFEQYNYVVLYFDRSANVIAFRFMRDDSEGGFKIIKYGEGDKRGASFVARSFLNTYGIDPKQYKGRYAVNSGMKEGIGEIFWIELHSPEEITKKQE